MTTATMSHACCHLLTAVLLTPLSLSAEAPESSLDREQALKMARTLGGKEIGEYWFDHGDKKGPYQHAGRIILYPGVHACYWVHDPRGSSRETGLDVPQGAVELHMDFFTTPSGHGWVTSHFFKPEIEATRPERPKDERSSKHRALARAAEFAIQQGNLKLLDTLFENGLEINEVLDFERGNTALYQSARKRELEITRALLKRGADPDIRNRYGDRPIDIAIEWEMKDFCELLKKPGLPDKLIDGVPQGVLAEVFARYHGDEIIFIEWKDGDPPAGFLAWLRKQLPNARPASRLETLDRRPLGAHSWYRDTQDGGFGSLLQVSVTEVDGHWNARVRDTTGPFLAGGGWSKKFTSSHGYWTGKTTESWAE